VIREQDDRPWYRHLWPWLLMIPPGAAVIGGIATAWLAGGPPSLVVDDYSEIALATAQRQARDRQAAALGLSAALRIEAAGAGRPDRVRVRLQANAGGFQPPPQLQLKLVHPTRAELDRVASLTGQDGIYAGEIERPPGRLYVHLGDPAGEWRLVGELGAAATAVGIQAEPAP